MAVRTAHRWCSWAAPTPPTVSCGSRCPSKATMAAGPRPQRARQGRGLRGNRAAAIEHYREAVRVGKAEHDSASADEAATLLKAAYRRPPEV